MAHRVLDRGMAERQRAFRQRLGRSRPEPPAARLVVLLGAGRRGIDVRRSVRVLRRQIRAWRGRLGAASRQPPAGYLGVFGRIVIHRPNT